MPGPGRSSSASSVRSPERRSLGSGAVAETRRPAARPAGHAHRDAILPTVGGQTGLNLSVELFEKGILDKFGVKLIGATARVLGQLGAAGVSVRAIAATGVDRISTGKLTKDISAIDLSLRLL